MPHIIFYKKDTGKVIKAIQVTKDVKKDELLKYSLSDHRVIFGVFLTDKDIIDDIENWNVYENNDIDKDVEYVIKNNNKDKEIIIYNKEKIRNSDIIINFPFESSHGYSRFAREYTFRLADSSFKDRIKLIPLRSYGYVNGDKTLEDQLEKHKEKLYPYKIVHPQNVYFTFFPPTQHFPRKIFNIIYTMLESYSLSERAYRILENSWDHIIVPSNFVKNVFSDYLNPNKISVVKLGLDLNIYHKSIEKEQEITFKKFDQEHNCFIETSEKPKGFKFLSLSKFSYRKGIDLTLKSFANAFTEKDDVNLVLFTTTENMFRINNLHNDIISTISDYRNKKLPPIFLYDQSYPENKQTLPYSWGDCFVFPSRGEGFGLPPIEAASCGLPVISSNTGGLGDYINDSTALTLEVDKLDKIGNMTQDGYAGKYPGWCNEHHLFWYLMGDSYFPVLNSLEVINNLSEKMKYMYNNSSSKNIVDRMKNLDNVIEKEFNWDKNYQDLYSILYKIL